MDDPRTMAVLYGFAQELSTFGVPTTLVCHDDSTERYVFVEYKDIWKHAAQMVQDMAELYELKATTSAVGIAFRRTP